MKKTFHCLVCGEKGEGGAESHDCLFIKEPPKKYALHSWKEIEERKSLRTKALIYHVGIYVAVIKDRNCPESVRKEMANNLILAYEELDK